MEEDIKEINNLSPVEWAMRELRESYELKHRDWASNCLDIIKEELDNCIPISVIQNKLEQNKAKTDCRYCNNACDSYAVCTVLQEILEKGNK